MTPCPTDADLRHLIHGRLDPARREQVAAHLNDCPDCQATAERLTAVSDAERSSLLTAGTTPPPVRPPLDGYTDWRELGRGGYAVVYRAVEVATGETVAVKLLRAGRDVTPGEAERFRREAVAVASLDHPHVVKILRVGEPAAVPHFVMEYLPGGSLADAFDGTPQSPRTAAELVRTLAAALHHAHTRGVIHRDLKPGNVLLPDGTKPFAGAKVADFGMAKQLDSMGDRTPTWAVVGTPAYMAPEQAFGRSGRVGPPADVYSLGAILYELLTGRPPFRGATPYETLLQVRLHDPVPPRQLRPDMPADLERVCLKCLEKKPTARYPTAAELSDELDRFLAGQPVRVRPLGVLSRGSRWVRRHPVTAVAIFAGVVTALAVASAGVSALRAADERAKRVLREQEASELLLRDGSLGDTIHRLDALVAEGIPLSDRHRLRLVEALIETNHLDRAATELDRMAAPDVTAEHRGRVALRRAEIALLKADPGAVSVIAAARTAPLTPDDTAYADALLAETVPEAVRHLELAVGLNSRHVQARCLLAHLLLVGGRVDDAVRVAEQSRVIFTDHPAFPRVLAVAYAFRGESAKAQASLDVLAGLRPDEERCVRAVVTAVAYAPRELRARIYGPEHGHTGVPDAERVRLVEAQRECEAAGARWLADMRLPPAVRPSVAAVFRAFGRAVMGLPPGETRVIPADELDAFGDVVRRLPESVATVLYAFGLLERANSEPSDGGQQLAVYRERLAESAAAFRSAADRPGWMEVRDIALVNAAVFYSVAGKPRRPPPVAENAEWLAASAEAARLRWQLGKLTAEKLAMMVRVSANGGRFALGRAMLDDLGRMPGQAEVVEKSRADLELKAGDHRAALAAAEKVLKTQPDDGDAKRIRGECRKALNLPPEPTPEPPDRNK